MKMTSDKDDGQVDDEWKTRKTLVQRARDPNDHGAWDEFTSYYQAFIRVLLIKLQVPEDNIKDLAQDVMVKLWQNLPQMEHGRNQAKFRTWLGTLIRNVVYTHCTQTASRRRRDAQAAIPAIEPPDLEDIIETEWRQHLIDLVVERLKKSFSGKAMEVFTMTLDGNSVDQIVLSMELSKDSVYVLRNRVNSRFRKEVRQLRTHLEFLE
jgi:RNA polymerase sigma factor (sigma-70 family)